MSIQESIIMQGPSKCARVFNLVCFFYFVVLYLAFHLMTVLEFERRGKIQGTVTPLTLKMAEGITASERHLKQTCHGL